MAMEEALIARLTGDATLAALVGEEVAWFDERSGADPEITLTKVSPGREWTHAGPDGLDRPRVQIDHWASKPTVAVAMARATLELMETKQTISGWTFWPALLVDENWASLGEQTGGEPLARVRLDFQFFHEEA